MPTKQEKKQSTDHENQQFSQRAAVIADYVMHALGQPGDCNWEEYDVAGTATQSA